MRTALTMLDLAASSNGSDWRALLKQYLASSKRPSATNTRPRLLNAGAYPGCSSSDFVHIAFARWYCFWWRYRIPKLDNIACVCWVVAKDNAFLYTSSACDGSSDSWSETPIHALRTTILSKNSFEKGIQWGSESVRLDNTKGKHWSRRCETDRAYLG